MANRLRIFPFAPAGKLRSVNRSSDIAKPPVVTTSPQLTCSKPPEPPDPPDPPDSPPLPVIMFPSIAMNFGLLPMPNHPAPPNSHVFPSIPGVSPSHVPSTIFVAFPSLSDLLDFPATSASGSFMASSLLASLRAFAAVCRSFATLRALAAVCRSFASLRAFTVVCRPYQICFQICSVSRSEFFSIRYDVYILLSSPLITMSRVYSRTKKDLGFASPFCGICEHLSRYSFVELPKVVVFYSDHIYHWFWLGLEIFRKFYSFMELFASSFSPLGGKSSFAEKKLNKRFDQSKDEFIVLFQCLFPDRCWDLTLFRSKSRENSQSSPQLLLQEDLAPRLALKDPFSSDFTLLQMFTDSNVEIIFLLLGKDLNKIAGLRSLVILFFSIYAYVIFPSALCTAVVLAIAAFLNVFPLCMDHFELV